MSQPTILRTQMMFSDVVHVVVSPYLWPACSAFCMSVCLCHSHRTSKTVRIIVVLNNILPYPSLYRYLYLYRYIIIPCYLEEVIGKRHQRSVNNIFGVMVMKDILKAIKGDNQVDNTRHNKSFPIFYSFPGLLQLDQQVSSILNREMTLEPVAIIHHDPLIPEGTKIFQKPKRGKKTT